MRFAIGLTLVGGLVATALASGHPANRHSTHVITSTGSSTHKSAIPRETYVVADSAQELLNPGDANKLIGKNLRILPLGGEYACSGETATLLTLPPASITAGYGSSDMNGYREKLRNILSPYASVEYIGSVKTGNMTNPENEGHGGWVIKDIAIAERNEIAKRPNVVLLFAGTNDMDQGMSEGAPERLGLLVDKIHDDCPDAVILVAQITTVDKEPNLSRGKAFNAALPAVMQSRIDQGVHVSLINFENALDVPDDFNDDKIHPVDRGYLKIATLWFDGLVEAAVNGWIGEPLVVGGDGTTSTTVSSSSTCTTTDGEGSTCATSTTGSEATTTGDSETTTDTTTSSENATATDSEASTVSGDDNAEAPSSDATSNLPSVPATHAESYRRALHTTSPSATGRHSHAHSTTTHKHASRTTLRSSTSVRATKATSSSEVESPGPAIPTANAEARYSRQRGSPSYARRV
jgi:lysophospholipase L1-like esterase